jgi:serine/threonine-protein phosphatase PP1 catalytic subunit
MDLICRTGQVVENGYEFLSSKPELVTMYSVASYNGAGNESAILKVDENMKCSFQIIRP